MKYTEVSGSLEEGMWSYEDHPGFVSLGKPLPKFSLKHFSTVDKDGWASDEISMITLSGTYFETPAHVLADGITLDKVPLDTFFHDAAIIQLPSKEKRQRITLDELKNTGAHVKEGDAVLLSCGWEMNWNKPGFVVDSPNIQPDAMRWLISKRPAIIGADLPCFDDPRDLAAPNVYALFVAGIYLLAPLTNLRSLKSRRAKLVVLPLNIKGVCAYPCRAIVIEE